jgi:hypothetical protein
LRRTGRADAAAALADVATIGPFFAVETAEHGPGWRPAADLYGNVNGVLDGLVGTFAERLRTTERRVAASILFQGYAARLWSPPLACLAMGLPLPDLPASRLRWRYVPGEPFGLLATSPEAIPAGDGEAAQVVAALVIGEHLAPLVVALHERTRVAAGLLWGNAASALVGALTVLRSAGQPIERPLRVAADLLERPPLRGTGTMTVEAGAPAFRRRSCCLFYRVPGGGLCGDCSLRD